MKHIVLVGGGMLGGRTLALVEALRASHEVEVVRIRESEVLVPDRIFDDEFAGIRGVPHREFYVDEVHALPIDVFGCEVLPPVAAKVSRGGKLTQVDQRDRRKQDAQRMRVQAKARRR